LSDLFIIGNADRVLPYLHFFFGSLSKGQDELWFGGVSVGHLNLANAKLSSKKQKSLLNFFKNCGFWQRP